MFTVENWCNPNHCKIQHFDTLEEAETRAVEIMESIKMHLPTQAWGRTEYNVGAKPLYYEYTERNAPGLARVYVRVAEDKVPVTCEMCDSLATNRIRAGFYCDTHF